MEGAFFNGSARDRLGHYPFISFDLLKSFYLGHKYEYVFTHSFSEIAYMIPTRDAKIWNPSSGGRIYNAVGHIIDVLHELYEHAQGEIKYLISVMQDSYIPLMDYLENNLTTDEHLCEDSGSGAPIEKLLPSVIFHEGMLPDHVSDLMKCSFW